MVVYWLWLTQSNGHWRNCCWFLTDASYFKAFRLTLGPTQTSTLCLCAATRTLQYIKSCVVEYVVMHLKYGWIFDSVHDGAERKLNGCHFKCSADVNFLLDCSSELFTIYEPQMLFFHALPTWSSSCIIKWILKVSKCGAPIWNVRGSEMHCESQTEGQILGLGGGGGRVEWQTECVEPRDLPPPFSQIPLCASGVMWIICSQVWSHVEILPGLDIWQKRESKLNWCLYLNCQDGVWIQSDVL